MRLHSFRHKGYWFYGRAREAETLEMLQRLLVPGDCVVEAGGHIGYFTLFFVRQVGPGGQVVVFEPGPNNLPYLRDNLAGLSNVTLRTEAVGAESGRATFYVEDLTGQNNSLVPDYEGLRSNQASAHVVVNVHEVVVDVVTLDDVTRDLETVDVIKIDIEGGELEALQGATTLLTERRPILMVEITREKVAVVRLLRDHGYRLFEPGGVPVEDASTSPNVFALHAEEHFNIIRGLTGG